MSAQPALHSPHEAARTSLHAELGAAWRMPLDGQQHQEPELLEPEQQL